MIIRKIIDNFVKGNEQERQADLYRRLIKNEAKIGGQLFGPVPEGRHREFFCLDEDTWVWHEEWTEAGQVNTLTTRYELRHNGIYKVQNGQYRQVTKAEAKRLLQAIDIYLKRANLEIYAPSGVV